MKKILKFLTGRAFVTGLLLAFQLFLLIAGILFLSQSFVYLNAVFILFSIVITLYIIDKKDNPMYKLAWIVPILLFPALGGILYFIFGKRNIAPKARRQMQKIAERLNRTAKADNSLLLKLARENEAAAKQAVYIQGCTGFPVCQNTYTRFLTPGEEKFAALIDELKKAERFIFLEYFIIEEGKMWNTVLDILTAKAREGVEVRVLYDDMGTINLLPAGYPKKLHELGIQTQVFNPFKPSLDIFMNYRDHRKIAVIDGDMGITGGINLADEYINAYPKHGYWKDSSLLLKGNGVWSLTLMFLAMWEYCTGKPEDCQKYRPRKQTEAQGYVQPFCDSPVDDIPVGENAYLNMLNHAKRYVYIATPYLILDNEMATALCLAAQSGVDVRIITPHIGDKWYVHETTRANYSQLLERGVQIYEYLPGFVHAKTMVVDDEFAIVGTTNFDFRSFYLHFECGVWMYRTDSVGEVLRDYQEMLEQSEAVTLAGCRSVPVYKRALRAILKLFSPLM